MGLATSDIGFSWWAAKWYAPKRYALYGDTQRDTQLLFASLRPSPAPTTLELKIWKYQKHVISQNEFWAPRERLTHGLSYQRRHRSYHRRDQRPWVSPLSPTARKKGHHRFSKMPKICIFHFFSKITQTKHQFNFQTWFLKMFQIWNIDKNWLWLISYSFEISMWTKKISTYACKF